MNFADITFQLSGVFYGNNSNVAIGDIGEEDDALLGITDNTQCCRGTDITSTNAVPLGHWYFPDGTQVQDGLDTSSDIYRNRAPSVVRLNRRNNATSPTGVYRCEIPDANGTNQSIFVGVNSHDNQGITYRQLHEYGKDLLI